MRLRYLLDTNICIYIAKRKPIHVLHKFENLTVGEVGMSTVTFGELLYGVQKSQHQRKSMAILTELTTLIPVQSLEPEVGQHYGKIRSKLEQQEKLIGNNDLWIASHALFLEVVLVTNNTKKFSRVPHLKMENWI